MIVFPLFSFIFCPADFLIVRNKTILSYLTASMGGIINCFSQDVCFYSHKILQKSN